MLRRLTSVMLIVFMVAFFGGCGYEEKSFFLGEIQSDVTIKMPDSCFEGKLRLSSADGIMSFVITSPEQIRGLKFTELDGALGVEAGSTRVKLRENPQSPVSRLFTALRLLENKAGIKEKGNSVTELKMGDELWRISLDGGKIVSVEASDCFYSFE